MKAFALSSMPPNAKNCTTRETFGLPFLFEFTCSIGRAFNVGLAECKLNSSPTNCGFTFVLHFSGVPPGITEKILRNIVIFFQDIQTRLHPREEDDWLKFVSVQTLNFCGGFSLHYAAIGEIYLSACCVSRGLLRGIE